MAQSNMNLTTSFLTVRSLLLASFTCTVPGGVEALNSFHDHVNRCYSRARQGYLYFDLCHQ